MSSFQFPKSADEIMEGSLLEEDWYRARIVQEPALEQNAAMRKGGEGADKAGHNLVIKMRLQSDEPTVNGRAFTKYLPWPKPSDANESDAFTGQPLLDKKMEAIVGWVLAFGGDIDGDSFELEAGAEAFIFVSQEKDGREGHEGELRNNLDFETLPKPI